MSFLRLLGFLLLMLLSCLSKVNLKNTQEMEKESVFETQIVELAKEFDGIAVKFKASESGWPDRLLVMPYSYFYWAEVKRRDGKSKGLDPLQDYQHKRLLKMHHRIWLIDSDESLMNLRTTIMRDSISGFHAQKDRDRTVNQIQDRIKRYRDGI